MVIRRGVLERIRSGLARSPVVVLTGPRQSGKTTLARQLLPESDPGYFDLEDPVTLGRLEEPRTALERLRGLVVIDEIQRRPDLFPLLRVLVDRPNSPARFLILGSASGELTRQSSESLAGRAEHIGIGGFTVADVGADATELLWQRGSFPRSFLAASDADAASWRTQFIQTLLERDLPQWGVRVPATALHRFWTMVAHYHGQTWNAADPARALGVSPSTTRRYLDLLSDALMVRQLQPWYANLAKRQVKSPKVYIRDSGLLHQLFGLETTRDLLSHPKVGASWEGFVIEQILASVPHRAAYFWATHQGAEIDLLLQRGPHLVGIECKRADAPRMTSSMHLALRDLGLHRIAVIYPGTRRFPMADQVEAVPVDALTEPDSLFPNDAA